LEHAERGRYRLISKRVLLYPPKVHKYIGKDNSEEAKVQKRLFQERRKVHTSYSFSLKARDGRTRAKEGEEGHKKVS
jgi:hypothetical protein